MEESEPSTVDRILERKAAGHGAGRGRQWRRVPPAITPITPADIGAGLAGQRSKTGRESFLNELVRFHDARSAASYTSFRRALCACLLELASHVDEGRTEILIPAFCSADFPDAIDGAGLTPVRYDVTEDELSLDIDSLASASTGDSMAVIVVNVLGYGSRMDEIVEFCRENDLFLVEALGYALGTEYRRERLGTFGDCSVLNFQQGKPIPVGGGMVVSRNDTLAFTDADRRPVAPNVGALVGYSAFGRPRLYYLYTVAAEWIERFGWSTDRVSTHPESKLDVRYSPPFATMSNFQGTIGSRVLDRIDSDRRDRAHTADVYASELSSCPHVHHVRPVDGLTKHQHVRYPLLVDDPQLRDELQETLSAAGVGTAALYDWPPIDPDRFPGAARLQRGIITLPTHPYVDDADRRLIVRTVRSVLGSAG